MPIELEGIAKGSRKRRTKGPRRKMSGGGKTRETKETERAGNMAIQERNQRRLVDFSVPAV